MLTTERGVRTVVWTAMLALVVGTWTAAAAEDEPMEGDVMVVTATRTAKSLRDVAASVQVIDVSEMDMANAITVDELFKTVVGVDLQGSGEPGSGIKLSLRGLTTGYQSKRVLVLMDGRRMNDAFQGNAEFAVLPIDAIDRIEVLRGPGSALYGSSAMGGVINIITRRGADDPLTRLKTAFGPDNTQHYRVLHGWRTGALDYMIAGSHISTDGYVNNSDGTDRDWEAQNLDANLGIALNDESELRIFLGGHEGKGTDENSDREVSKDYQALAYKVGGSEEGQAQLLLRAYRNGQRDEYDWKYPGVGIYEAETLGGEAQQSFWLAERHRLTVGADARGDAVEGDDVQQDIDENTSVYAVYVQDEYFLGDTVQITAGIRSDHDSDFGDELSPRIGLLVQPNPAAELFVSLNQAHRAPSLSDRYVRTEYNGFLFVGNPDLQPETLTAYEIGGRGRINDTLQAELALFYNDMDDSFDFMLTTNRVFENRNVTRSETYGVEAGLRCRLAAGLSSFANYSFTDGQYKEFGQDPRVEGNQLAYLAEHKVNFGLEYAAKQHSHTLRCRYAASRYGDAENSEENKMDAYLVADWRSRVRVTDAVDLTLNVDNIFDESYEELPDVERPGRTFLAGVEVEF